LDMFRRSNSVSQQTAKHARIRGQAGKSPRGLINTEEKWK
jgi:hypothetical protein